MPAKKHQITDDERAKRIREAARELETSENPRDFERAFHKIVQPAKRSERKEPSKKAP